MPGRAILLSEASIGGCAFLNVVRAGRTRMETGAFICEFRVRLRISDAEADTWCPLCDIIFDYYCHHAGMCVVGGERTQ